MAGDPTTLDDESAYIYIKKWRPVNEKNGLRAEKIYGQKQTINYRQYAELKDSRRTMSGDIFTAIKLNTKISEELWAETGTPKKNPFQPKLFLTILPEC